MSKKVYQFTGHIIADKVSNVNLSDSGNIGGTPPPVIIDRHSANQLNNSRERRGHTILHTIGWILLILSLAYCMWMCVNYHIQHYPDAEITSKPADYFGMIAGFFALLVTFLVGWQIWQTITSRREIEQSTRAARDIELLRDELTRAIEIAEGHAWNAEGNRLFNVPNQELEAFQIYVEAIRHYTLGNADYSRWISQVLSRIQAIISNSIGAHVTQWITSNQEAIYTNIEDLIISISSMTRNREEAHRQLRQIRALIESV